MKESVHKQHPGWSRYTSDSWILQEAAGAVAALQGNTKQWLESLDDCDAPTFVGVLLILVPMLDTLSI